jgi:hypothetical protein
VRRVALLRDWTWCGLLDDSITFEDLAPEPAQQRPAETIAHVGLPRVVSRALGQDALAQRGHTTFVLFDAVEAIDASHPTSPADLSSPTGAPGTLAWRARAQLAAPAGAHAAR